MISDEAREAAAPFVASMSGIMPGAQEVMLGMRDGSELVQAFQAAIDAQRERDAKIAEGFMPPDTQTNYHTGQAKVVNDISTAIRSAKP
jgi:hypothetical protein